jgi:hypothetical protein
VLGERADHVEDDPDLAGLVEVQTVTSHDVEQVARHETTELLGLEVVGSHEMLLVAARRQEERCPRVVATVREELQGEERVGRPALAQVELDRVRRPFTRSRPHHHEVDREPAQRSLACEPFPDHLGVLGDRPGVLRCRREHTTQVALPTRAAEQLVMRGQQLHLAAGEHPQLDAGATQLGPADPFLHDAGPLGELGEVGIERYVGRLELHVAKALHDRRALV